MASIPLTEGFPFALRTFTGDGVNRTYPVDFPRISDDHIKVYVDGVLQTPLAFSFPNPGFIQLTTAPASGVTVLIRRQTPVSAPLVSFTNASTLKAANLNLNTTQLLYILQEQADLTLGEVPVLDDIASALGNAVIAANSAANSAVTAEAARDAAQAAEAGAVGARQGAEDLLASLQTTYEVTFSVPFLPASGETYGEFAFARSVFIPEAAPGSIVATSQPGSGSLSFSLRRNGVEFATGTISGGVGVGSILCPSRVDFDFGDVLSVVCTSGDPNACQRHSIVIRATRE